jgi:hypothetical protein
LCNQISRQKRELKKRIMIKYFTFSFLMLATTLGFAQGFDLPVTFDDGAVTYGIVDFGGNASSVVADPTNAANMVVKSEKTAGAQTWAGTTLGIDMMGTVTSFSKKLPFSVTDTKVSIKVWSPDAGIPVNFKVEDASDPTKSVETIAMTTKTGEWDTLVFDFSMQRAGTALLNLGYNYNKGSIFFNFDTDGATAGAKTYYWDDVMMVASGPTKDQINLPVTFEDTTVDYTLTSFGDMISSVTADPAGGMNIVAMSTKPTSSPVWAGVTAGTQFGFKDAIPFTATATKMTVRVYSPDTGITVRLKVEDVGNNTVTCEVDVNTTKSNEWEDLIFDFSTPASGTAALDVANTYDKASLFFNFGTDGATAGEKTYYWDDMIFGEPDNSSVKELTSGSMSYYPNPVTNVLNIATTNTMNHVTVMNAVGAVVESFDANNAVLSIDMTTYVSGIYVIVVETSNETLSFKASKN